MTIEEPNSNTLLDFLEDSAALIPSFLDDPYSYSYSSDNVWWDQNWNLGQDLINSAAAASTSLHGAADAAAAGSGIDSDLAVFNQPSSVDLSKKRKALDEGKKNQSRRGGGNKKIASSKSTGNTVGNNKDGRWAEQLLNPCAIAIGAGNLTRAQHLLFVLFELASPMGDANHRLADHGLRSLNHIISSSSAAAAVGPITFASSDPKFFQRSLLKFYEVSPWFAFPNKIANDSILQILAQEPEKKQNLHILDIGVSHGVQWPTLLEALSRRTGGPPPLVKITVVAAAAENDRIGETVTPFAVGPPGDSFYARLPGFAKSMNINLEINRVENYPLQELNAEIIKHSEEETLIVCAQFRLHHLNHNTSDERTQFLRVLKNLNPKGMILSENNMECSCSNCVDFATGFSRRVEYLWRFLDSTSAAFKGRETDERRVMEGEAAKALTNQGEMNEGKEKWCERMRGVGFVGQVFGEDAVDGARALLRKHDNNWEMRVDEGDGCVGLWWKGQPVSFCSLWKLDVKVQDNIKQL